MAADRDKLATKTPEIVSREPSEVVEKVADSDEVKGPQDRDKAIAVAMLILRGESQGSAAEAAGVGKRTVERWVHCSWWPDITAEVADRYLSGLHDKAIAAIDRALTDRNEYAGMAKYVADRMVKKLRPPKQRAEHSGPDGGPIKTEGGISDETAEAIKKKILGVE